VSRSLAALCAAVLVAGPALATNPPVITVTGGGYFSQFRQGNRTTGFTLGVTVDHHLPGPIRVTLTVAQGKNCTQTAKPTVDVTATGTADRSGRDYLYAEADAARLAPLKTGGSLCVIAVRVDSHPLAPPPDGWKLIPALHVQ